MTAIKLAKLDAAWQALDYLNKNYGAMVTAGQVGKHMGISRNTAKAYLEELIRTNTAAAVEDTGKNHQKITQYYTLYQSLE